MFNSPSSTFASPLHHGILSSQVNRFSQSPSDSRVPGTPSVAPQNTSLDQSVPLTPTGERSVDLLVPAVFSTPNRTCAVPGSVSPQILLEQSSPVLQGISPKAPNGSDQLVPSTPKTIRKKVDLSPSTAQQLSSSPISPVPCCATPKSEQSLMEVISPVPQASTSRMKAASSTISTEGFLVGQRESPSISPGKRGESPGIRSLSPGNFANESIMRKQVNPSPSGSNQNQLKLPRKCSPPSRRRLSLGQKGQKDALRRAAHHNLAVQRSLTAEVDEAKSVDDDRPMCSTFLQGNKETDSFEDLFPSDDASIISGSCHDSGFSEKEITQSSLKEYSSIDLFLISPAGDASNVLADHKPKLSLLKKINSNIAFHMNRPQCTSTPSSSGVCESSKGPGRKQSKTLLDLINDDDDIFE
ncbi:hypothetical protein ElyMa_002917000 [Elysia marginata]|uniref:Uncharacterized protein n=1 Tax=Elysia marginata TaxID=1093978 RepID=A0AAV4I6I6_9GAST|nr:hypothetical protein ElyMa_002917000 [Elysia marginata]